MHILVLILPMRNGNNILYLFPFLLKGVLILPMRNGNLYWPKLFDLFCFRFLSYLWGMETKYIWGVGLKSHPRSYPTYEEWKHKFNRFFWFNPKRFLSYLWGMETAFDVFHFLLLTVVLILPMRNGNYNLFLLFPLLLLVLILPMRNGNSFPTGPYSRPRAFLSYLWGMETV